MRILMVAPEPIFEPRGTPLSVVGRLKAFSDMGHQVELVTYHLGENVHFPGVTIDRIPRVPGIGSIKIGPSLAKIPLDFFLCIKTFFKLLTRRYDLLHTHEEAGFWGTAMASLFRIPHLYDMHSSLPQQLKNFRFTESRLLFKIFEGLEKRVLRNADGVITICPDLFDHVANLFPDRGSILIENVVDYGMIFGEEDTSETIRHSLNLSGKTVVLYTGTFEPYQGLDMLVHSAKLVLFRNTSAVFLLVGGHPDQVEQVRVLAVERGVADRVLFTGQVPPQTVSSYIRCADVLVSPRTAGTNTPLKIYAYLRSGVPIVATRLLTHTQVLSDDVSVLTDPDADSFAEGILRILSDQKLAACISQKAQELAEARYAYPAYLEKLQRVLHQATGGTA